MVSEKSKKNKILNGTNLLVFNNKNGLNLHSVHRARYIINREAGIVFPGK